MMDRKTLLETIDGMAGQFDRLKADKTPLKIAFPPDSALLVVDVQRLYVSQDQRGDAETEMIAQRINKLVPLLREAGMPIYMIKSADGGKAEYAMDGHADDVLIVKKHDSAFQDTALAALLREQGKKSLFLCGFNASACVAETAYDAVKNDFTATVLADLTANDRAAGEYAVDIKTAYAENKVDICLARAHIDADASLLPDTKLDDEAKRISSRKFFPWSSHR